MNNNNLFSFTSVPQSPQNYAASNPLLSQLPQAQMMGQGQSQGGQQGGILDPLKVGQMLGQPQGPGGLPPIDPIGGVTNSMGTAGLIANPLGGIFGSGGLFG